MPLKSTRPGLHHRRHDGGFTLIETLVAMSVGTIVLLATFSILDISLRQSSRIADRVSADQRARLAMEKIVLELHSSCVAPEVTPVEPKSEGTKLLVVSQTGAQASFANVMLHEIYLKEGKLVDVSYLNTQAKPAPEWEFSKTATSTKVLLTNTSQSIKEGKEVPVFQYYKYEGSEIAKTALKTPLSEEDANATAQIVVNFTTAPESGNTANNRTVDLTETVVLRFSPAAASGTNRSCH